MAAPHTGSDTDGKQGDFLAPEPGTEPLDRDTAAAASQDPEPTPPAVDPAEMERMRSERVELEARLEAERARVDRLLSQSPPPASPSTTSQAAEPMPDAATDPEAFQRWLVADQNRRESAIRQEMEQRSSAISTESRATAEWQRFCTANPHLSDLEGYARVEFLDLTNNTGVLPADTTAFHAALKERLEKKCNRRPQSPPARTGSVSAGSEPRPRPASTPPEEESDEGSTFVDQIKDWQEKSGLYG